MNLGCIWGSGGDLPLVVRIKRTAFAMTMMTMIIVGGVLLILPLTEIPAEHTNANRNAAKLIGEVLSADLRNQLGNIRQLSGNSLVWTALTDSAGREAYLKPFLQAREKGEDKTPMQLLDYRGRRVLGELPQIITAALINPLVSRVQAEKKPRLMIVPHEGQALLLAGFPVLFPYTQDAIGTLIGVIKLSDLFHKRSAGIAQNLNLELLHQSRLIDNLHGTSASSYFPALFELDLGEATEGGAPTLSLYSTMNPWIEPMFRRLLLWALLAVLLGAVIWKISGIVAQRITLRLNRLAEACAAISNGHVVPIPEDSAADEIGVLSRTLQQAVKAQEQVASHLENLVDQKTRELSESELRFRSFFEKNSSVMLIIDPSSGTIIAANSAAAAYYGYSLEQLAGMSISDINSLAVDHLAEEGQRALREECNFFHFVHRLASGEMRDVEVYLTPIESGGRHLLFSVVHDITKRKQAEVKLRLAATVFTHAREGILITAADGTIIDVNDTFTRITGYSRDEVLGHNPRLLSSGRQDKAFYAAMWQDLVEKDYWYGEVWNRRKNGEVYAEMLTVSAVRDASGETQQYVALFSDITPLKEHERKLEHMAHYDVLTTLPNRVLLADRLRQAMAQTLRREQRLAVAYLDLDGFKAVNDSYGHETGDRLLIALSSRMKQALREGDTLARMGGDEFIAVLLDLEDIHASVPMLHRLLEAAAQPVEIDGRLIQVSASVGVAFFPQLEDIAPEQLLRQTDQAMYLAKLAGKNRFHVFDADQNHKVHSRHENQGRTQR